MTPKRPKKSGPKGGPATKKGKKGQVKQSSIENSSSKAPVVEQNQFIENQEDDSQDEDSFQKLLDQRLLDMDYPEDSDTEDEKSVSDRDKRLLSQLKKGMSIAQRREIFSKLSPPAIYRSIQTWTDCAAATPAIASVQEMKKWCENSIFRPTVMYFLEGYLWPQQASNKSWGRGDDFSTILEIITAEAKNRTRNLTKDFSVDRSKWTATDWSASALQRIFEENEATPNGLWDGHNASNDRKYAVLYAIFTTFIRECSPSRLIDTWPSLSISPEKEKELRTKFPRLKDILDQVFT